MTVCSNQFKLNNSYYPFFRFGKQRVREIDSARWGSATNKSKLISLLLTWELCREDQTEACATLKIGVQKKNMKPKTQKSSRSSKGLIRDHWGSKIVGA